MFRFTRLPHAIYTWGKLTLRPIGDLEIEVIRRWRNEQLDVLRQTSPITPSEQLAYFSNHVQPQCCSDSPSQILWMIDWKEEPVGYGGLVHIDWPNRKAEVSFLLDPVVEDQQALRAEILSTYIHRVQRVAFDDLGLAKIWTETFENRYDHIKTLESAGMHREGVLRAHVQIDGVRYSSLIHGALSSDRMESNAK